MEEKIAAVYVKLKKENHKHLFQFTRSCDHRIAACTALLEKDGSLSKEVGFTFEHGDAQKASLPEAFYNAFFTFSDAVRIGEGIYSTSIHGFPRKQLTVHTRKKFFMTTEINGHTNCMLLGVHVTVDIPTHGLPLLRGIQLIGLDQDIYVSESLPLAPFVKQLSALWLNS
jgi:hypothetical protein